MIIRYPSHTLEQTLQAKSTATADALGPELRPLNVKNDGSGGWMKWRGRHHFLPEA